jgi:acetyl esterase/lipase
VVLFCHGGVWAAGAKWHYAPLAARLAQAGVVTAVMQVGPGVALYLDGGC